MEDNIYQTLDDLPFAQVESILEIAIRVSYKRKANVRIQDFP